jgi:CheY-like chemotaxis protein
MQMTAIAPRGGLDQGLPLTLNLPADGPPPEPARPPAAAATGGQRVLIVDDNVDAANALSALLQISGHEVWVAHDGPAALQLLRDTRVDVALLDIGLPVMDGYELAQRIAAQPHTAPIRLIALTGYGRAKDLARSEQAGFSMHLVKPVMPDTLLQAIGGSIPARR